MFQTPAQLRSKLLAWYGKQRRELPWREPIGSGRLPNAYHVLVSEAMLQQTQVAAVVPYFHRFLTRFPTVLDLANADEQDVLRLWQGLGYYSRARNLHAAAKRIVAEHGGEIPGNVKDLLSLPGVGRYTAGAIASTAFDCRAPIVDGNVIRVLCRVDLIRSDPREKETQLRLWARAEEILPRKRCGDFNSALMELGATVCTPRAPKCLICPIRAHCEAQAAGAQEQVPLPKKAKPTPLLLRNIFCVRRKDQYLIEQRPAKGRWAGMWQFVTFDAGDATATSSMSMKLSEPKRIGEVTHALTHRRYRFEVFTCEVSKDGRDPAPRRWASLDELQSLPLPLPHVKVAQMLKDA